MCICYLYASLLALVSISAKARWSRMAARHLNILLIIILGIYCYRDLFPLATFTRSPLDLKEGWIIWAKILVLTATAVVIPLVVPREYVPVDPRNPMATPNPEQTASLISLIVYAFLDPIIFLAYRIPHLSHDQLPPLADYDDAKFIKMKSFPHIDTFAGGKGRHLFFGLMRVFRREYCILVCMIILQVAFSFASPVGMNRLLHYLESGGEDAFIRPWVWVLWLFLGPLLGSISFQWYIYIATHTLVQAECIITQLVFEHALRIRVKAETPSSSPPSSSSASVSSTPDTVSIADQESSGSDLETAHSVGGTESETLRASSSSVKSGTSSKGKAKSIKDESDGSKNSSASNLVGKINNLVTTDLGNITDARSFLLVPLYIPLQITLCIWFLYVVLGWSAFVGLGVILLLFPVPGYVAKRIASVQSARLKKTDARVQTVTETMNVLRMIKLFGWESKINTRVADKRDEELLPDSCRYHDGYLFHLTIIMKQDLNASKLHMVFYYINQSMTGKVSLDRVNDFLHNTELLDSFSEKDVVDFLPEDPASSDLIGFRDATFVWSDDVAESLTPSKQHFSLRIEGELIFKTGRINLIVGPTGSGKTSLLMALLGEMHFTPPGPNSWFNLPRKNGIAYAAQESWVQNETIRENILFGAPFDEERYKKVLNQCCLERDLTLFEAGDQTEVGEKGLTLSGGQKARVTLARAIYSQAQTILLDDVLAALDVHTAKWIVDKCFSGDLIQGRTILLVTHNVAMAEPIADFVVSLGLDGGITSQGSITEALAKNRKLAMELSREHHALRKTEEEVDSPPADDSKDGKLIVAEEIEEGHISWAALKLYLAGLGGNHPVLFFLTFALGLILTEFVNTIQTWYLGYLASQYEKHPASEVAIFYYLSVYAALLLTSVIIYCSAYVVYIFGTIRASRSVHKQLIESVLGTTLRWLDTTPTSRVITRCTQDIRAVDGPISENLWWLSEMTTSMLIKFGAVVILTPVFLGPGIFVAFMGGWCGKIYMASQLSVKREMSNAKAPVLGHFGAAMSGLTSIRAYGAQVSFIEESLNRINRYTRAARTFYNLNRWVCVRIDAMGGLFSAALAGYLVYFQSQSASNTGFSLNMAVGFSGMILWWVRVLNNFEVLGNSIASLERIHGYVKIEQEPKPTTDGVPPAYWPASGELRVEDLSARYSPDGPKVLHNISFSIQAGQRVGVVGRTGSGKSSLTLSLLRCIFTDGEVYYDGVRTDTINLDALRSNITIIPQIPELLSGTLRQNLDPFDQYDDATLNDALRAAGLFSLQSEMEEGRITLDSSVSSGGGNLSVGQRQILALARAIVRGSKLLILDEDYKTDSVIQSSLRNELNSDVTVITVAHRLQTIMDADKIVEFDSPKALLQVEGGKLRALVDESGDKAALYAMAEKI
ncbi:hypothetical protein BD779DRAFT_1787388 [Infundibulicybe gibba]|nr:hypothetical protein BD779DRAFT_1787388 [Infundibulicybe gibba]